MTDKTTEVHEALAVYAPETSESERVPAGYRLTEVGVIPEDWDVETLDSLGSGAIPPIKAGPFGSALTKDTYVPSGYKVYGQEQVIRGDYQYGDYFVPYDKFKELESCAVKPGDILLSLVGTAGKLLVIPNNAPQGIINPRLIRFTFDNKRVDSEFFRELFEANQVQSYLERYAQGGTMGVLNASILRGVQIPLPPVHEQRAIAAALSGVDALISALDKLIGKKRAVKTAAMQQLLTGKQRLPRFSGEWEVRRLGEIARITMGRTPRRRVQAYWGRGYPWLSIADLKTKYVTNTKEEITEAAAADMNVIPKGTLVMSFKLTIGKLAFAGRDMYSNEAICGLNDLKADAEFLYYILRRTDFSLYGKQAVKGYTLNTESLNAVEIPYPSLEEQTAIAAVLSDMDEEVAALEGRREKTRRIKQAMMQELLTGRTRLV